VVESTESDLVRRKRLRFRSAHRGSKELDLILGPFARRHVDKFTPTQLSRYERLLDLPEPELFGWLTGQIEVPQEECNDVLEMLLTFDPRQATP